MEPGRFTDTTWGEVVREVGSRSPFWYFRPRALPRHIDLQPATVSALSEADAALGVLSGLGRLISEPELLIGPSLTREAVSSSRIEGTQASLSDVLRAEVGGLGHRSEDIAEVERYVAATRHGFASLDRLPITQRLVKELHAILLAGVRGANKLPGEVRRTPVWIGATDDSPETAVFVPPVPADLPVAIADWEDFVNVPSAMPTLVRCALMHYQFETIHPFLDGNGRIGRLLINLMLLAEGRLSRPLLYLSGYLESHRSDYYERLQAVREEGRIQEWLQFFLSAVKVQADDAVRRSSALVSLRETYLAAAATARSRLQILVRLLFENPYVTVARVEGATGLTNAGARNLIREAQRRGWLVEVGSAGRGGKTLWLASDVYTIIEEPPAYG